MEKIKICSKCKVEKNSLEFHVRQESSDGRRGVCKKCINHSSKLTYKERYEKIKEKRDKEENKIYFLYRHIRLDTNEVFYIGKGSVVNGCNTKRCKYVRAYSFSSRNNIWRKVYNKTKIKVEILGEFYNLDDCLKEETRLILSYGRIINGDGKLCNIVSCNEEVTYARRENKAVNERKVKVYKYSLQGDFIKEYDSMTQASLQVGVAVSSIWCALSGRVKSSGGFLWSKTKKIKLNEYKKNDFTNKKIINQFDLDGKFIKTWESSVAAAKALNIKNSAIRNCLAKISSSSGGYIWVFENKELNLPIKKYAVNVFCRKNKKFIKSYKTFVSAEKELGMFHNTLSFYIRKNVQHPEYIFEKL